MKFRLDTQHYINDRLLEPGHIIGDETDVPLVLPNGDPIKPSVNMTPLDDEAWGLFQDTFPGTRRPERDPTKAIPLRGTGDSAKAPPLFVKSKETGQVLQPVDYVHGQPKEDQKPEFIEVDKKGLPDPGSPNHPVGQPVTGTATPSPVVAPKPTAPGLENHPGEHKAPDAPKTAAQQSATDLKSEKH